MNSASSPLHRASGTARKISAELGAVLLDTLGLPATIEWHVRQFQKRTGVFYELTVNDAIGFDLPEDYAATIFDIYSEALSNVARYAAASRIAVALTITPHEVTMVVRDNGVGPGKEAPASRATVAVSLPIA
jgi:signal transduction histidine kinase